MANIPTNNIYLEYLSQLEKFEKELKKDGIDKFDTWKSQIANTLDGAYRLRFNKIEFYKQVESDFDDDLPF